MCVRMARISTLVSLAADDLEQVVRWEAAPSTPQQVALRCRLVLAAAAGKQDLEIASIYDVNRHTAALWRQRVRAAGIGSLWEIQRSEEHTSELQSRFDLVCRLLLEKKKDLQTNKQYRVTTGVTLGRMTVAPIQRRSVIFSITEYGLDRSDSGFLGDPTQARAT